MARERVCILAFKPVGETIHVLRQINYLSRQYELDVIGYGQPSPDWPPLSWHAVPEPALLSKIAKLVWYLFGRLFPPLYDVWFWSCARHKRAYAYALASGAAAFHANDWQCLPIAVEAARRTHARVVFHMHEYAEEERSQDVLWRLLVSPAIRYLIRRYVSRPGVPIDASITVCAPIADRYRRELGLDPIVVYNAPEPAIIPPRGDPAKHIRLIHHGYAKRGRGLGKLVQALALTDQRFTLDFMLVEDDRGYIDELKQLADRLAPGRIHFREPVPAGDIVRRVAEYDMGFCVIEPSTYNNLMMLPNKLFEYVQGGLALCVGPSPAMVDLVQRYDVGVIAPSFDPEAVAATLNRLTRRELRQMQRAARRAAAALNAGVEMGKILALYRGLLDEPERAVRHSERSEESARPVGHSGAMERARR